MPGLEPGNLALANAKDLEVHHMDVKTAFLNGKLDCDIYMDQPEGYLDTSFPNHVCKLKKGLYGLKQAARCWNGTLDKFLKSRGYLQSGADECVYIKTVKNEIDGSINFVILAIYVDDIILVSNSPDMLGEEKSIICEMFDMVDNDEISFCLGMSIQRDRVNKVLNISQQKYIENTLVKFGMDKCRPVATPIEPGTKYYKTSEDDELFDTKTYQMAIGSLTYAALATRPDISASVNIMSQFMSNPSMTHWTGVKRILRYLRGTSNYGLRYSNGLDYTQLTGFCDADWAGDVNTRRSTSGYVFQLGSSTITWCCRKQTTVAKSSTEAEYVSLSTGTQEVIWLHRLFKDIGVDIIYPTTLFEDNQGAIEISKNAKYHDRTKHIDVAHHFVRERIAAKDIEVRYCPTNDMIADIMTKGLGSIKFTKFRDLIGVVPC